MARHLVRYNPFNELDLLRREMHRRAGYGSTRCDTRHASLPMDAYTTEDEVVITLSAPGVGSDDVEITFENDVLTIKGETPAPLDGVEYVAQERTYGSFTRVLNVNVPVQADKIEATFDRGLLVITLPKAEEAKAKTIKVKAK